MRLSREELLSKHPIWNESKHDIVAVMYGDTPLVHYDESEYEKYQNYWSKDENFANIMATDAYIYSQNGTYDKYRTLVGEIYIAEDGHVLCGDVDVKYNGKVYNILVNKMYGLNKLDILRLSSTGVVGFSNSDGQGSPSSKHYTKEMDVDIIKRILNDPMKDYGVAIQKFMETARELYEQDNTNHIMEKCFNL